MRAIFLLPLLFGSLSQTLANAQALRLPTDVESKAAYCAPIARTQLETLRQMEAQIDQMIAVALARTDLTEEQRKKTTAAHRDFRHALEDHQAAVQRLQGYIVPRVISIDPDAIIIALKRGEADALTLLSRSKECGSSCSTDATPACTEGCMGKEFMQRIKECQSLQWLPF